MMSGAAGTSSAVGMSGAAGLSIAAGLSGAAGMSIAARLSNAAGMSSAVEMRSAAGHPLKVSTAGQRTPQTAPAPSGQHYNSSVHLVESTSSAEYF